MHGLNMMNHAEIHTDPTGNCQVSGELSFSNVANLCDLGKQYIKSLEVKDITFDFSQVKRCDSAGLALLVAWRRFAKQHNKAAKFIHLPSHMYDVAKLSNLDRILPISTNQST
jgi:phospholipid transport system transporter-binding protein